MLIVARHGEAALSNVHLGCFFVTVQVDQGTDQGNTAPWWLTSVYGPQEDNEKLLFLEELEAIRDAYSGGWLIIGDFNLIMDESDKNNSRIN